MSGKQEISALDLTHEEINENRATKPFIHLGEAQHRQLGRTRIMYFVFSIYILGFIGMFALVLMGKGTVENLKDVLTISMPLITTVLVFYFAEKQ
jgi:hypothetical protein